MQRISELTHKSPLVSISTPCSIRTDISKATPVNQTSSKMPEGRQSPPPEEQSGKQGTDPTADGKGVNAGQDKSKNDLSVRPFVV